MKKEQFLLFIAGIVVIAAIILRINQFTKQDELVNIVESPATSSPAISSSTIPATATSSPLDILPDSVVESIIEVSLSNPLPGDLVTSPLVVTGKARGNWFFEASLPVSLISEEGSVIVSHYGQAESDWMTTDFVPFRSELIFETEAATGYLVVSKDNPSGLPENDGKIMIPVKFK